MKNIKLFILAVALLLWFKGAYRLLDMVIPDTGFNNVVIVIAALVIFYINDGSFSIIAAGNEAGATGAVGGSTSVIKESPSEGKFSRR